MASSSPARQNEFATVSNGGDKAITISSTGGAGASYEWYRDGEKISTTDSPSLAVTGFSPQHAGQYRVVIRRANGTVSIVDLTVRLTGLTYESWLRHKQGPAATPADPGLGKPEIPRGDGFENILKYALGKGPHDSPGAAQPEAVILGTGAARRTGIRFHRLIEPQDILIKVEASADMKSWRDVTNEMAAAGEAVPSPDGITEQITLQCPLTLTQPGAETWRFLRIAAQDIGELSPVFVEEFDGASLDPMRWNVESGGNVVVSDGMAALTSGGEWTRSFDTAGKFSRRSDSWVIECRMKRDSEWDVIFSLTDGVNTIGFLDSTWTPVNGYRFYRDGGFGTEQKGIGGATADWMEYRMTINGVSVLCERGPTLSNITQSISSTLSVPISQYELFLSCRNGGTNTARFDWIRIR